MSMIAEMVEEHREYLAELRRDQDELNGLWRAVSRGDEAALRRLIYSTSTRPNTLDILRRCGLPWEPEQ